MGRASRRRETRADFQFATKHRRGTPMPGFKVLPDAFYVSRSANSRFFERKYRVALARGADRPPTR
jgi:hypothetical protein